MKGGHMRRISGLLCILLALFLVGCGGPEATPQPPTALPATPTATVAATATSAPRNATLTTPSTVTSGPLYLDFSVTAFTVWQDFMPGAGGGSPPIYATVEFNVTNKGKTTIISLTATR